MPGSPRTDTRKGRREAHSRARGRRRSLPPSRSTMIESSRRRTSAGPALCCQAGAAMFCRKTPGRPDRATPPMTAMRDNAHDAEKPKLIGRPSLIASSYATGMGDSPPSRSSAVVTPSHACRRCPAMLFAWLCRSMNPGATARSLQSTVGDPPGSISGATALMTPAAMATSHISALRPSGSTTSPCFNTRS